MTIATLYLSALATALLAANAFTSTADIILPFKIVSGQGCGCGSSGTKTTGALNRPLDAKALASLMDTTTQAPPGANLPQINCQGNCSWIRAEWQYWCQLAPPGSDCSPSTLFWNNYEYERAINVYNCPNNTIAVCCGGWIDSECCNNSDDAPPDCTIPGANYKCAESACP